jgi:hypothetical protein
MSRRESDRSLVAGLLDRGDLTTKRYEELVAALLDCPPPATLDEFVARCRPMASGDMEAAVAAAQAQARRHRRRAAS